MSIVRKINIIILKIKIYLILKNDAKKKIHTVVTDNKKYNIVSFFLLLLFVHSSYFGRFFFNNIQ